MAQVEVSWYETVEYQKVIEVDGYDPDEDPSDEESGVMQVLLNLDKEEFDDAFMAVTDRGVSEVIVKRAGDEPIEIAPAKVKEDMF